MEYSTINYKGNICILHASGGGLEIWGLSTGSMEVRAWGEEEEEEEI
jgi:hypothetical protein